MRLRRHRRRAIRSRKTASASRPALRSARSRNSVRARHQFGQAPRDPARHKPRWIALPIVRRATPSYSRRAKARLESRAPRSRAAEHIVESPNQTRRNTQKALQPAPQPTMRSADPRQPAPPNLPSARAARSQLNRKRHRAKRPHTRGNSAKVPRSEDIPEALQTEDIPAAA
jgi:hypothetical protein